MNVAADCDARRDSCAARVSYAATFKYTYTLFLSCFLFSFDPLFFYSLIRSHLRVLFLHYRHSLLYHLASVTMFLITRNRTLRFNLINASHVRAIISRITADYMENKCLHLTRFLLTYILYVHAFIYFLLHLLCHKHIDVCVCKSEMYIPIRIIIYWSPIMN